MDKFTILPTFDLTRSGTRLIDAAGVIVTKETGFATKTGICTKETGWVSPDGGTLI